MLNLFLQGVSATIVMTAEVITIGDEILYGHITDTNTQYISEELSKIGIRTVRKSAVGDTEEAILQILAEASSRADIILITGGLGPTKDDITKHTIAKYFGVGLVTHQPTLDQVTDFFTRRGREMLEMNNRQADVPTNAEVLLNKLGTAPGMWIAHEGKVFISMPGVPFEMKHIMQTSVIERLKQHFELPVIVHKMVHTVGLGESFLAEKIRDWEDNLPKHIKLAYLPSLGIVKLRLTAIGASSMELNNAIEHQIGKLTPLIPDYIFAYNAEGRLEAAIGRMLLHKNLTISTAESCTGGYLAHLITAVAGSSVYYKGSVIAYANEVKMALLDVKEETLAQYGAVSEQTAIEMAENVRKKLKTDVAIATTGIAGPDGGTDEKPVGTVWIGFAAGGKSFAKRYVAGTTRENNTRLFSLYALNLLRMQLQELG